MVAIDMESGKMNGDRESVTEPEMRHRRTDSLEMNRRKSDGDIDEVIGDNDVAEVEIEDPKKVNLYAAKKTVAQGMMDIALITANANQMRSLITYGDGGVQYYFTFCLIVISLLLQMGVGVCLIFKGRFDMRGDHKHRHANTLNNYVVMGVFLVTIINVFVAAFSIPGPEPTVKGESHT